MRHGEGPAAGRRRGRPRRSPAQESAADVAAVRFTTTRRGPGYDLAQVDRLLDELEAHLAPAAAPEVPLSRDDLVALLSDPAIARVRWRRGYRADEVDLFLTQVVGSLLGHRDPIAVRDVEGARFRPARLRRGYEMREVDRLLDRVVVHLRSARLARSAPRGDRWSQGDSNP